MIRRSFAMFFFALGFGGYICSFIEAIGVPQQFVALKALIDKAFGGEVGGAQQAERLFEFLFFTLKNLRVRFVVVMRRIYPNPPAFGRNRFIAKAGMCVRPFQNCGNPQLLRCFQGFE